MRPSSNNTFRIGKVTQGFTLLEILVATAILALLVVVLASVSDHAASTWSRNENRSDLREAGRAAIDLMGSEMRQAVLPLYRDEQHGAQFVIHAADISSDITSAFKNRDAVFWQAPIATDHSRGNLAIIGYFIRKDGNSYKLCRLFVNPNDDDYDLFATNGQWLDDDLLDAKAPATEESNLQGLFLENVLGMWVTAYDANDDAYAAYDSRDAKKLPARVEVSFALLDKTGAERLTALTTEAAVCNTVEDFMATLPENIRPHAQAITINISFPL